MSKRFTDTELWKEDWFLNLSKDYKMFWMYIKDNCDFAGFFKVNLKMFNLVNDCCVTAEEALSLFNADKARIREINPGLWFLEGFYVFQYGSTMNLSNRVHKSVFEHYIKFDLNLTSIKGLIDLKYRAKDKDKDNRERHIVLINYINNDNILKVIKEEEDFENIKPKEEPSDSNESAPLNQQPDSKPVNEKIKKEEKEEKDFITKIINLFSEKYEKSRDMVYNASKGKDRAGAGTLLRVVKSDIQRATGEELNSEEMLHRLGNLFDKALSLTDDFMYKNMNLAYLANNYNSIKIEIKKQENGRSNNAAHQANPYSVQSRTSFRITPESIKRDAEEIDRLFDALERGDLRT